MAVVGLGGLALRNLRGHLTQTGLIVAALAVLGGTVFTLTLVFRSVDLGIRRGIDRMGADVMVVPGGWSEEAEDILLSGRPSSFFLPSEIRDRLSEFPGVAQASGQLFIVSAKLGCCSVGETQLIGYEPRTDFTIKPWLDDWLGESLLGPNDAVVGSSINLEPGSEARFYGHTFKVRARVEPTGLDFVDRSVFLPMVGAREMIRNSQRDAEFPLDIGPDFISAIFLRAHGMTPAELAIRIEAGFPELTAIPSREVLSRTKSGLEGPLRDAAVASGVQSISTLLLLGVIFSMMLRQREREIALYRVMGARRRDVLRILVAEVTVVSALGGLTGVMLGFVAVGIYLRALRPVWHTPFAWPSFAYLVLLSLGCLMLTTVVGLLATWIPVVRTTRVEPYRFVRQSQ